MSQHDSDRPAAGESTDDVEISYTEVAAEDADTSVAREGESVDQLASDTGADTGDDPTGEGVENDPPEQPTISTMLGAGPVGEGDEPTV